MKKLLLIVSILALCSCKSFTVNVLSNNQLFNTRSQATGEGAQEALVEGGGSPSVSVTALP